jgi:putative transposase
MRQPRLKIDEVDTFYHCYNRVAGDPEYFPFEDSEKERFIRFIKKLSRFYTVDVVAHQVLSNHFHLVLWAPSDPPTPEETCQRYTDYYLGKRTLDPDSEKCAEIAARMRNISCFMGDLQQFFTDWFNKSRPKRRRGSLWAGRFKHTVLESSLAVWDCWKYVEMNAVRAGLAANPAYYRFGSFGEWSAKGRHPFAANVQSHLLPILKEHLGIETLSEVQAELRREFAGAIARMAEQTPDEVEAAMDRAGKPITFRRQIDRRMRYWVDGLVIGSDLFITEVMTKVRGPDHMRKRQLTRAVDLGKSAVQLYAYRQLRVITG